MKIPEGAKVEVSGEKVTVSGPKGTLSKTFHYPGLKIEVKGGELSALGEKSMANTVAAHVANMAAGVVSGYSRKLKSLYSHFPVSVEVKGKDIMIKNFMGEKQPRKAKIIGQTKVEAKGQELTVSGISKEEVGQTVANLKSATRVRNRDSRVFQDGFYPVEQ